MTLKNTTHAAFTMPTKISANRTAESVRCRPSPRADFPRTPVQWTAQARKRGDAGGGDCGGCPKDSDLSEPVEDRWPEPAAGSERGERRGVRQRADRVGDVVTVDDRDADPVTAGPFRDREGQCDEPDRHGARFSPRAQTRAGHFHRRWHCDGARGVLRKEVPCRRGYRPGDDRCDHGHMDAYRDPHCGHQHTDCGAGDRTEAERSEEARHDGTAELPFDRRAACTVIATSQKPVAAPSRNSPATSRDTERGPRDAYCAVHHVDPAPVAYSFGIPPAY